MIKALKFGFAFGKTIFTSNAIQDVQKIFFKEFSKESKAIFNIENQNKMHVEIEKKNFIQNLKNYLDKKNLEDLKNLEKYILSNVHELKAIELSSILIFFYEDSLISNEVMCKLSQVYLDKLLLHISNPYNLRAIQVCSKYLKDSPEYVEKIVSYLKNVYYNPREIIYWVSIGRFINNQQILDKCKEIFFENLKIYNNTLLAEISYHLSLVQKLDQPKLEALSNYIINNPKVLDARHITKWFKIFSNEYYSFDDLNNLFFKKISENINSFSIRELVNLLHFSLSNESYYYKPTIDVIYNELLSRKFQNFNPIDFSSLLHFLSKKELDKRPFVKFLTPELIEQCNCNQLAIIYHTIGTQLNGYYKKIIKSKVIEKIDEISPKHLINLVKDISEEKDVDLEFMVTIKPLIIQKLLKHNSQDSQVFITQFIASIANVRRRFHDNRYNQKKI